jgi:hypothetical protein
MGCTGWCGGGADDCCFRRSEDQIGDRIVVGAVSAWRKSLRRRVLRERMSTSGTGDGVKQRKGESYRVMEKAAVVESNHERKA